MDFSKTFLINLGMLIAVAYLANVTFKYVLSRASAKMKYISSILLVVFCGWICSVFGFSFDGQVVFDLRFVPLIIASLVYPRASSLVIIGVATGLALLPFRINEASVAGFVNLCILGLLAAVLNDWMRRTDYRLIIKASVSILAINLVNVFNIAIFDVIPFHQYLTDVVPYTLPLGIALSYLVAFILRDFQLEQMRKYQIIQANRKLSKQKEQLQKAKLALEERAQQLMTASRYKSEFMATMSHELRTPLNSIINLAQMIAEQGKDMDEEDLKQYSSIIHASGQDLLQLINDILDLSKVEAGKMEITKGYISVEELMQVIFMQFEMVARSKNVEFKLRCGKETPDRLYSDSQRVQQILRNLLSNAFKFTHAGSVILEVRPERLDDPGREGDWLVLSVIDTGIGISKSKQHSIFEAFQQADGSISRKYGGTGLGLSISRDLARLLGGFIRLESQEGTGSVFSLYLPLETDAEQGEDRI
ncbi:ATP-binding protein [Paenibacillus sp. P96]|uniref:histidine kinase n=1 Tax=Paenibacillus zeirhizosphaerae TaxID=2987519 RepID=A0ABT9FVI8_9BACL|nr:ATP-binding protein [Paenibacillus sp. P96]MDP4098531.1 ATP-binding protein [Paenibacillus sp. P96]